MAQERRKFTAEFKREAVRLASDPKRTLRAVAEELGIRRTTLTRWRAELSSEAAEAFRGNGKRTAEAERIWQLEQECQRLRCERDLLKKVLSIVSTP